MAGSLKVQAKKLLKKVDPYNLLLELDLQQTTAHSHNIRLHIQECIEHLIPKNTVIFFTQVWPLQHVSAATLQAQLKLTAYELTELSTALREDFKRCVETQNLQAEILPHTADDSSAINNADERYVYTHLLHAFQHTEQKEMQDNLLKVHTSNASPLKRKHIKQITKTHAETFASSKSPMEQIAFYALVLKIGPYSIMSLSEALGLRFNQILELSYLRDRLRKEFLHTLDTTTTTTTPTTTSPSSQHH